MLDLIQDYKKEKINNYKKKILEDIEKNVVDDKIARLSAPIKYSMSLTKKLKLAKNKNFKIVFQNLFKKIKSYSEK